MVNAEASLMASESKTNCIGILTSGGDCPGLNAAIRAVTKAAINEYDMTVIGIMDGFRGLVENRTMLLEVKQVSGILTTGGTILGTSRDKVHRMPMGGKVMDMTEVAIENVRRNHIDCLVCLGGGGTQKNALRLHEAGGINVMTLPKTIDNDVEGTEITFGFDTALQIATDAIDRLHTTATSHHRIIVCEIMGHKTGWLTLSAGIAGGADVILIPEIPYSLNVVTDYLLERRRRGSRFSIIAVAEGAISVEDAESQAQQVQAPKSSKKGKKAESTPDLVTATSDTDDDHLVREPISSRIARRLQEMTGIEARVTALGHVQRGGIPTAFDRWLCTRLGTKAAQLLAEGVYNVMVGYDSGLCKPVPLEKVAGKRKTVPNDHPMIVSARQVGTCMGDKSPFDQARTTTA
jgi:6-phosphofructokinase 1